MRATTVSGVHDNPRGEMDSLLANFNPNDPHFQQKLQLLEDPLPTKVKPKRTSRKGLEDKLDDSPSDSGSIKPSRMARYTGTPSKPYVVMGDFDYNAALSKLGAIFQRLVVTSEGSIGFIRQFHEKDEVPTDIAPLPRLVEAKGLERALYASIIKVANEIVYVAHPKPDAEQPQNRAWTNSAASGRLARDPARIRRTTERENAIKHIGNENQPVRDYIRRRLSHDLMAVAGYFVSTHRITRPLLENQLYPRFKTMLELYILETRDIFSMLNDNRAQTRHKEYRWDVNRNDLLRKVKSHYRKTPRHSVTNAHIGTPHQLRQNRHWGIHQNYSKGDHSRGGVNAPLYKR